MTATSASGGYGEPSTLDLLKLGAVVAMIVDHVGLYFLPEQPALRVLGRPAAIIFGFLIGYSAATRVPPSWIGLGLGLTFLESAVRDGDGDEDTAGASDAADNSSALDILIALALTRIVMPFFAWLHGVRVWLLIPAACLLGLAADATNSYFEYGTEIVVVALLGLARRLDDGSRASMLNVFALALIGLVTVGVQAVQFFAFEGILRYAAIGIIAATLAVLIGFERRTLPRLPGAFAGPLCFVGRTTLWIYAAHVAAFQLIAAAT